MLPAWRTRSIDINGVVLPTGKLAFTIGLGKLLSDTTAEMIRTPPQLVCRLHITNRCRYAEDCKFLHVCREEVESKLSAWVQPMIPQFELRQMQASNPRGTISPQRSISPQSFRSTPPSPALMTMGAAHMGAPAAFSLSTSPQHGTSIKYGANNNASPVAVPMHPVMLVPAGAGNVPALPQAPPGMQFVMIPVGTAISGGALPSPLTTRPLPLNSVKPQHRQTSVVGAERPFSAIHHAVTQPGRRWAVLRNSARPGVCPPGRRLACVAGRLTVAHRPKPYPSAQRSEFQSAPSLNHRFNRISHFFFVPHQHVYFDVPAMFISFPVVLTCSVSA
jgi:hypothetical protein